jgi:hypothetical protein
MPALHSIDRSKPDPRGANAHVYTKMHRNPIAAIITYVFCFKGLALKD